MNLQSYISVYAGGPGSGCNPDKGKCGRPKNSPEKIKAISKTVTKHEYKRESVDGDYTYNDVLYRLPQRGGTLALVRWPKGEGKQVVRVSSIEVSLRGKGNGQALYYRALQDFDIEVAGPDEATVMAHNARNALIRKGMAKIVDRRILWPDGKAEKIKVMTLT